MSLPLLTIADRATSTTSSLARQRARQIAALLGFDAQDQTRIATAVSEIARNAFRYAGGGEVEFAVEGETRAAAAGRSASATSGPGIADLDDDPRRAATARTTGMGLGIIGARRLMDQFDDRVRRPARARRVHAAASCCRAGAPLVDAAGCGAHRRRAGARARRRARSRRCSSRTRSCCARSTSCASARRSSRALNRELEDTNRGVVALYAELDEKADHLRRADELKSRFLSNMSHEFRTPLNSILALARLLLERADGAAHRGAGAPGRASSARRPRT